MKALKCEMCDGNEIIKEGDFFVCQMCGTKYNVEAAKKLMIEGPIDISGSTIKIDESEGLIKSAQAHIQGNRFEQATDLVNKLIRMYPYLPNGWEYRLECITRNFTIPCSDTATLNECMSEIRKNAQPHEFDRVEKKYLDYLQRTSSSIASERLGVANGKLSNIEQEIRYCNDNYSRRLSDYKNDIKYLKKSRYRSNRYSGYGFFGVLGFLFRIIVLFVLIWIAFSFSVLLANAAMRGSDYSVVVAIVIFVAFAVLIYKVSNLKNSREIRTEKKRLQNQLDDYKKNYNAELQNLNSTKSKIQQYIAYGVNAICAEVIKERKAYKSETVDATIAELWRYVSSLK